MEKIIAEINTVDTSEKVWCDGMWMSRAEAIEYMSNR